MKKKLRFCALQVLLWLLSGHCTSKYSPDNLPAQQVRFGTGGGIVGRETTWILLTNGQLFKLKASETSAGGSAVRRQGRRLFREAKALLSTPRPLFSHPGNVYWFVEWRDGAREQRITWGHPDHPADTAIVQLHQRLMALTRE